MKKQIKAVLKKVHLQKIGQEQFLTDMNKDYTRTQRKILLCYLDYERTVRELAEGFGHTNRREMMQMIKTCIDLDFCIDICACYDENAKESIHAGYYDVILGFGETFLCAKERNPQATGIFYATENPYDVSYARETERILYFKERTGRTFHLERTGVYYRKDDEKKADRILCLGDPAYFEGLGKPVDRIWPSALKNPKFAPDFSGKDKKNFLVYGVDGFVHKGNDLLVEIFAKHPDWQLYLCGARGMEKAKEAGYVLTDNIHACGFVDTRSDRFLELAGKCYYLLLPSCSEAPSTAALTALHHGVLPIVTRGIGLDGLGAYCRYFDDYHIDAVEKTIMEAIEEDEETLKRQGAAAIEYADAHYTLEEYTRQLKEILQKI